MIYTSHITTPANTTAADPLRTEIKLAKGIIHRVEFEFPSGNQFLHRVQLLRFGAHLIPSNPDGYFTSEGNVIQFREFIPIDDYPFSMWAHTWNLDETYQHALIVRIGILRKHILAPWLMTWRERMMGRPDFSL